MPKDHASTFHVPATGRARDRMPPLNIVATVDPMPAAAAIAFASITLGAVSGLIMGLWSFGGPVPVPPAIGAYDDLPRRFLRLAHVALFALGMLHLMVARQLAAAPLSPRLDRAALRAMAAGNLAMPLTLIAAALAEPLKYLLPIPALALTFAFGAAAASAIGRWKGVTR